jgi:hypothetical protein
MCTSDFICLALPATDAAVVPAVLWLCACSTRLGWIVIYLIVIEVIVGLLEILGLFGVVGEH